MEDNLATVHYDTCPQSDAPTKRCPTRCIRFGEEESMTSGAFYGSSYDRAAGGNG